MTTTVKKDTSGGRLELQNQSQLDDFLNAARDTVVDSTTKELIEEIREIIDGKVKKPVTKKFRDVSVEYSADAKFISMPEGMSVAQAHQWLTKYEEHQSQTVQIERKIECFPLDGAVACWAALRQIFGFVETKAVKGRGGMEPPPMISVPVDAQGNQVQVPVGRIEIPGVEGYVHLSLGRDLSFFISAQVSLRHQRVVELIAQVTENILESESLYRGKAIEIDLGWMAENRAMKESDNPTFIDTSGVRPEQLILSRPVQEQLDVSVFSRLTRPHDLMKHGVKLGGTILLAGGYGTGKSMTGSVIAAICEENGWTFVELKNVSHIANAITMANMFDSHRTNGCGVVIFAEDIDQATSGTKRSEDINTILNRFSGISRGNHGVITVLTTNHEDRINPAMRRAGDRVDAMIRYGNPDGEAALRFLNVYGGDLISPSIGEDPEDLVEYLEGHSPAFLEELVARAKVRAILQYGEEIEGKIDHALIRDAAQSLALHKEWADGEVEDKDPTWVDMYEEFADGMKSTIVEEVVSQVKEYLE